MSARSTLAALVVLALATTACGIKSEPTGVLPAFPQTTSDSFGRQVEVTSAPKRIVSLDPGMSESLAALGLGSRLVGRSGQEASTFKHKAPVVLKADGTPNIPKLEKLQPDLILATPDQVPSATLADALATTVGAEVYVSNPSSVHDVENDLEQVGALTDTRAKAQQLVNRIATEQRRVARAVRGQPTVPVFVDLGFRNTIPAGSLGDNLIALAGGRNIAAQAAAGKPVPSRTLKAGAPQVYLVAASSGLDLKQLRNNKATKSLPAVKAGNVYVVPDSMLTEGGPGVAKALATIFRDLHAGSS